MTSLRRAALLAAIAVSLIRFSDAREDDSTSVADWRAIERRVLPSSEELRFKEIGWRTVFWDAVKEARRTDRPILLWAMNGHPLGCT
jgi:hypothetical protein